MGGSYINWLAENTPTQWWHDSADPDELALGLERGATGVTTNPVLSYQALRARPDYWRSRVGRIEDGLSPDDRAEALVRAVVRNTAPMFEAIHSNTNGARGYVCGQVNPLWAADAEAMIAMAKRYHGWAPNIAVKLPVTAAGLEAVEECAAEGIAINATVSFSVSQALAVGERCRRGAARARAAGKEPRPSFCTIMIGRQDDYLRAIAQDSKADVSEGDIRQAGLAVVKRAYREYAERGYETTFVIAALRGTYHLTELVGAEVVMSMHPKVQEMMHADLPKEEGIGRAVPADVIERLRRMPEFVKAYEPDGMAVEEFMAYGLTQRTLSQFSEAGWLQLQTLRL